jgi:hypothetical protein
MSKKREKVLRANSQLKKRKKFWKNESERAERKRSSKGGTVSQVDPSLGAEVEVTEAWV